MGLFGRLKRMFTASEGHIREAARETVRDVREAAEEVLDEAGEFADKAFDKAGEVARDVQEAAQPLVDRAKKAGEEAMHATEQAADKFADSLRKHRTDAEGPVGETAAPADPDVSDADLDGPAAADEPPPRT